MQSAQDRLFPDFISLGQSMPVHRSQPGPYPYYYDDPLAVLAPGTSSRRKTNERNNEPQHFPGGEETLAGLVVICREKMWPLLKNSTRISYDFHLDTYILPRWSSMKLTKLRTIELQDFFNSFSPRLASKTIRNMHGCLRAVFNQGKAWDLVRTNPAQGVRLPRKKARKPPVVLAKQDIRRVIEGLPEPTKSIVTLVVVGSLRIGEVAALRWERIHSDRIEVVEPCGSIGGGASRSSTFFPRALVARTAKSRSPIRLSGSRAVRLHVEPAPTNASRHILCATVGPPTCWKRAPICGPSKFCLGTEIWRPLLST